MEELFNCAMDIGEQMLLAGAEVHRAEESIGRMCYAFGAKRVDVFIITSSIVVTLYTQDGTNYTQTRRVESMKFNFERLHKLNALSREICSRQMTPEEIREKLNAAVATKQFPLWAEFISYAVITGAFTLFFGGGYVESLVSLVVGAIVWLLVFLSEKLVTNKFFGKFYASAIATVLAFFAMKLGWIPDVDKVIIGNIMTLIPGIGLTNSIRDLFAGDSIAGLLRLIDALLTALVIAAGYYLVAVLGGFLL